MTTSQQGLLALLHRANQLATEQFSATLGHSTMTARQLQVLAAVEANAGASQTRIVELTGVDRSTLADIVRRLQNNKLIARRRSKDDARAYLLTLTEAGRQALAEGAPALSKVERQLLAPLPTKARTDLLAMLETMVGHAVRG